MCPARALPLVALLSTCTPVAWTDVVVTDERTDAPDDDAIAEIEALLARFQAEAVVDRAPLRRVRLVDVVEGSKAVEEAAALAGKGIAGRYNPNDWEIQVVSAAHVRHELCHALDHQAHLSDAHADRFNLANWPAALEPPLFADGLETSEVFASMCDPVPLSQVARAVQDGCGLEIEPALVAEAHALAFPATVPVELPPIRLDAAWVETGGTVRTASPVGDGLLVVDMDPDRVVHVAANGAVSGVDGPADLAPWRPLTSDGAIVLGGADGVWADGRKLLYDGHLGGAVVIGRRVVAHERFRGPLFTIDLDDGEITALPSPVSDETSISLTLHGGAAVLIAGARAWRLDGDAWVPLDDGRPAPPDREFPWVWLDDGRLIVQWTHHDYDPEPGPISRWGLSFWREGEVALAADACDNAEWHLVSDGAAIWAIDGTRVGRVTLEPP